jgi:hypothetical protein
MNRALARFVAPVWVGVELHAQQLQHSGSARHCTLLRVRLGRLLAEAALVEAASSASAAAAAAASSLRAKTQAHRHRPSARYNQRWWSVCSRADTHTHTPLLCRLCCAHAFLSPSAPPPPAALTAACVMPGRPAMLMALSISNVSLST